MVVNGVSSPQHRPKAPREMPPRLHNETMAGFIFVCNDDTMPEDFERRLFGLPKLYLDSVKTIHRGMPLFLYNYSTRLLHGVFEAASDGDLNLEPLAWENKDLKVGAERASKFPAQVRIRVREYKAPLEEDKFRPYLFHYEIKKFRLELTQSEVADLLELFSTQRVIPFECFPESEAERRARKPSKAPPLLKNPPPLGSPKKRLLNGALEFNRGYNHSYESRADAALQWRSNHNNNEGFNGALDELTLQEPDLSAESGSGSRGSYVAALKTGINPETIENGRKPGMSTAILGRLHDPDPAVNSDLLLPPPPPIKTHTEPAPRSSSIRMPQPGKTFHEFRRMKDENSRKPSGSSSMPLIPLHPFSSLPHVPFLAPMRFPVYSENHFGYRTMQRGDGEPGGFAPPVQPSTWPPQQPVMLIPPPAFSLSPPGLAANVESNLEALHTEILEFAHTARPAPSARARAEAAVECVRKGVKSLWPAADVEVFGSFATGLCLPHSDVDVVVLDAPTSEEVFGARGFIPLIRSLSEELKQYSWCENLMTIETAAMPVIKLRCRPGVGEEGQEEGPGVAIDVTLGGRSQTHHSKNKDGARRRMPGAFIHNGAAARDYVIEKLRQLPALAPLVLLMKSYLHHKGLNDVYTGGLGSFSLTLMLVFYLEQVPLSWSSVPGNGVAGGAPPATLVPTPENSAGSSLSELSDSDEEASLTDSTSTSVSDDGLRLGGLQPEALISRAWRIVDDLLASLKAPGAPSLGSLLIGFLHIFGQEFDFSRNKIVLKGANGSTGGMFALEPSFQPICLWIDDPLRPGMNVGAGSFAMCNVQSAMRDMLFVLAKPQAVASENNQQDQQRRQLSHLDQLFQIGAS